MSNEAELWVVVGETEFAEISSAESAEVPPRGVPDSLVQQKRFQDLSSLLVQFNSLRIIKVPVRFHRR